MYVEIAFGSIQVRVRNHDSRSKSKEADGGTLCSLVEALVSMSMLITLPVGQVIVEFAFKFFTVRRVSGVPNKHMLAPHRAIPIPLIPCVPPGVVGVGLVLALLGTYGSHTSAGPLTDIAAACATDIIGIGVGTRVLIKLPWSKLLW